MLFLCSFPPDEYLTAPRRVFYLSWRETASPSLPLPIDITHSAISNCNWNVFFWLPFLIAQGSSITNKEALACLVTGWGGVLHPPFPPAGWSSPLEMQLQILPLSSSSLFLALLTAGYHVGGGGALID